MGWMQQFQETDNLNAFELRNLKKESVEAARTQSKEAEETRKRTEAAARGPPPATRGVDTDLTN